MLNTTFYITLFLLSLNQLTSVYKSGESNFYLFDFAVIFLAWYGSFYFLLVRKSFKLPKFSIMFLIFTVSALASLVFSFNKFSIEQFVVSGFYLVRWAAYLVSSVVIFNMLDKKMISKGKILNALIVSGVLVSLIGFIQLLVIPDFTKLSPNLGWDPHKNRLASTFFDPNFVGAYLTICLTIIIDRIFGDKKIGRFDIAAFAIILLALFLTFSRSAWAMFAVVILIYGIFRSKMLLITAFLMSFMVYFAVPRIQTRISGITDPADSASLRIASWKNAYKIIKDNFWVGTGFNTYRYVQKQYGFLTPDSENIRSGAGSDSSLLFVFATTGILGFVFYLSSYTYCLVGGFRKRNIKELVVFSVMLGLLVESLFINSLFYPQILFALFAILVAF
ncbi:MAG: O-antigen ligase family protein [Patescibacteria group bacterium]|nr:O-antigen ligase family protein [Patescibacteria group bacterium]MBU1952959.1 O-antigen ligase family protein [Patescibacteria group bacterium]